MNSSDSNVEVDGQTDDLDILSMIIGDDEEKWRNTKVQMELINQFVLKGEKPCDILKNYFKMNINNLPEDPIEQWSIILHLIMEGPERKRLEDINTFAQACELIKSKTNIMVLTGAGISVPCGVPDFRSRNGIYSRLAIDFPDLDNPQSMFDIDYFYKNPRPFFKFAKEIYPGKFNPSKGHQFIKLLENRGKLLRNYSQNIDTLEQVSGIKNVIQCHGSFATATCMRCQHKVKGSEIEDDVMSQTIPICGACTNSDERTYDMIIESIEKSEVDCQDFKFPIMKPDVVFFGEGLPRDFHATLSEDKDEVDLLIVIGSSLKVRPVAHIPGCLPPNVPQILINKEPLSNHSFDVELLGDCDVIVSELCRQLGWDELPATGQFTEKTLFEMKEKMLRSIGDDEESQEQKDVKIDGVEVEETKKVEGEDPAKECEAMDDDSECFVARPVNVADYLSEEVTCIRVPPNRYIFHGADYAIDIGDLENDGSEVKHLADNMDSYSSPSSTSSDHEDEDQSENEADNAAICDDKENDPKRRRLSPDH